MAKSYRLRPVPGGGRTPSPDSKGKEVGTITFPTGETPSERLARSPHVSNRRVGGGNGSAARRRAAEKAAAERKAAERKAAERKAAEVAKIKAAEEARIEAAKSFAEKQRIAKEIFLSRQGRAQFQKILNQRANLIRQGAREDKRLSTDVKTGDKLEVSQWRDKFGNRIERVKNLTKGTTTYSSFEKPKTGYVRQTTGVTIGTTTTRGPTAQEIAGKVKITTSQDYPGRKVVRFPNGRTGTINAKGTVVVGARLAGKKYEFQDGVLRKIDGKSVPVLETESVAKKPDKVNIKRLVFKMMYGKKMDNNELSFLYKKYDNLNKKNIEILKIAGPTIGTLVPGGQIPGAAIWALGEIASKSREANIRDGKISKKEIVDIAKNAALMGLLFGAGAKAVKVGGNIIGKRVILGAALKNIESTAARAALNHGGVLIKFVGYSGKNLITTYFMKDMLGNVYDVTKDVKNGRFNSALRKAIETGSSIGGFIGGGYITGKAIKGGLLASGKLKATTPEFAQKKIPADVMARQLLSEGKIVLTRRGVYETGKGLSPRKDAWLDSKVKNPTKSVFWRFDKTLSKKDEAISPLPLFTKSKTGYLKMFKANWNKNRGMPPLKRYLKTTAETPLVEDVLIRRIVYLKNIRDLNLRKQIIKEYATKGKLSKATQDKVLKNNFPISDKNREFGFHDENEFVTRIGFKLKGRKDISWTYDKTLGEYIPVVQSLKDAGRVKNFLSFLNRKGIITRTDAKFIIDSYAIKKKFGASSILPNQHSWTHMKQVQDNIIKIMNKYPEFNSYWKKRYGSIAKAKEAMKEAMWHDIGKAESASAAFGTPHGEKVWNVWKAGLLPKDIKLTKPVALAIRKHETLDPRKLWYKVQNKLKLVSPEEKIVATADRLDLNRVGIKIDLARLPLKDAIKRLGIKVKFVNYPSKFNKIIAKIKLDKGVTKADLSKLLAYARTGVKKDIIRVVKKVKTYKTNKWKSYTSTKSKNSYRSGWMAGRRAGLKAPSNYNMRYAGNQIAYTDGYREGYNGRYRINYKTGDYKRLKPRPTPRKPKRPSKRPPRRPSKRPPRRPPRRPPITPVLPTKQFTKKTLSKSQPVFFIKIKKGNKIVNLLPRPLTKKDAVDYLTYKLDKGIVRSGFFEPIGRAKTVVRIPKAIQNYYSKNKNKMRPYKIKVGKKKLLRHGLIEKRRFALDQRSERLEILIAKKKAALKKRTPTNRNKLIRRKSPVRRKPVRRVAKRQLVRKTIRKKQSTSSRRKPGRNVIRRKPVRRVAKRQPVRKIIRKKLPSKNKAKRKLSPTQIKIRKRALLLKKRRAKRRK